MTSRPELRPGSPEPGTPEAVDALLTAVPELAFFPVFDACVPELVEPDADHHGAVDRVFSSGGDAHVVATLVQLAEQADRTSNGGLAFLVRAMLLFVQEQPVPPSQHPLFVALYLRSLARFRGRAETPAAVAAAMDHWR